ncbi:hypothetical protein PO909_024427 [Leuciscus waleckii]
MCFMASISICSAENCWANFLDSVAGEAGLGDGGAEKAIVVGVLHLSQVQPKMSFLNIQGGHYLAQGPRRDFRHPEGEVSRRAQLLQQPRLGSTLVQLFESFCLMNLQDGHGMQGGGSLSRSRVSFRSKGFCHLTCLGWEAWTIPQVHRNCILHLWNVHVTLGGPAIEGSESGRGRRTASGSKRCLSCFLNLLMHGKKGTGAVPRNQSSNHERLEHGGGFHSSPITVVAWESMAVSSESASSSSPEDKSPLPDTAFNIRSSSGAPNEIQGASRECPTPAFGNSMAHGMLEEWEVRGGRPDGEATRCNPQVSQSANQTRTSTMRSGGGMGSSRGARTSVKKESRDCNANNATRSKGMHHPQTLYQHAVCTGM